MCGELGPWRRRCARAGALRQAGAWDTAAVAQETPLAGHLDRLACGLTRLAGAGTVGVVGWQVVAAVEPPWIWALLWSAVGATLILLYTPALRAVSIGLVVLAGVLLLGTVNPFAAMDVPGALREQPDFVFWHVARALGAGALLVLLAYCVGRARSVRLRQRAARA
jgi:hypothetical protein